MESYRAEAVSTVHWTSTFKSKNPFATRCSQQLFEFECCKKNILLNPTVCPDLQTYAGSVLAEFVDAFGKLYDKHLISHNIHGLLHISNDTIQPLVH